VNLTSFRGITFTTLGVTSPKWANVASPGSVRNVAALNRIGADPIITGVENGPRSMAFEFTVATGQHVESTLAKVIAACNPDDPVPGTLVGVFNKAAGTPVTVEAQATAVGSWQYPDVNTVRVTFVLSSPWREQSTTTLKTAGLVSADGSFSNLNTGFREVLPTVTVYWDGTQRASTTSALGWKHRIGTGETITNTGTEPFVNQPYQIGPISHLTAVGAGQGMANGNDLRVFCEGRELRRNLIGANTNYCFIWVVLPTVAPGQSITLDVLTNNPSAGTPPTLTATSDPPLPAMDISGTSFTATASSSLSITFGSGTWETNQWSGGTIIAPDGQMRKIGSNTATVINNDSGISWNPTPSSTGVYVITKSGLKGNGGTVVSATASTVTLETAAVSEWIGGTVHILTGTGAGQTRTITSNTASVFQITPNWTTNPTGTSTYRIYRRNGQRIWDIRTVKKTTPHKGLWLTNTSERPPSLINFDAPGAWYRFTYQRSDDEYSQPRYVSYLIGGTDYDHFPVLYIQRAREHRRGTQTESGIADAVGIVSPFPMLSWWFGYSMRNAKKAGSGSPGEGMCEARFLAQESGGTNWSIFHSNKTVYNTTTDTGEAFYDLTAYGSPNRVGIALVPNGSDEIPESDNNTALLTINGVTAAPYTASSVDPTQVMTTSVDWVAATPATVAVYDIDLIVRNGGASATKPYDRIRIGGTDHRVFIAATDERVVVDCEKHTVTLTTDAGVYVRTIPYCLQAQEIVTDPVTGADRTLVNARWVPISSTTTDPSNIYYDDDSGAGWGSVGLLVTGKLGYLT
jgi:hypothetical protein